MARPYRARSRFLAGSAIALLTILAPAQAAVTPAPQPLWSELAIQQRQILAPLAGEWDRLESWRRKKWLEIAERFPRQSPDEQARVQRQMQAWARLSPEERKAAREAYKNIQKATPEQREALKKMWSEYQALPDDEKQKLKESAANKPLPKTLPLKPTAVPADAAPRPPDSLPAPAPGNPTPATSPAATPPVAGAASQ